VGNKRIDTNVLGVAASHLVEETIVRAVLEAKGITGIPAATELSET
jgi:hypothetical protein